MKSSYKDVNSRSFSIALLGVSKGHCKILERITTITQCRKRQYYLLDSGEDIRTADILMVNVDSAEAVEYWKELSSQKVKCLKNPIVKIHSGSNTVDCHLGYTVKTPFNPSRLIKMLDKYTIREFDYIPELRIGDNDEAGMETSTVHSLTEVISESSHNTPTKKVLVVDDSEVIRHQLGLELKIKNVDTTYAKSGEDALTILKSRKFDLVFLDVMLPGVDGYEVCRQIKKSPLLKSMLVIMLTSRSSRFDKIRGTLAGCNTYMTKPVSHQEFNHIAKKYLSR